MVYRGTETARRPSPSGERLETILQEAKSHLEQTAARISHEKNVNLDEATTLAIEDFGSPEKVAQTFLRESHPKVFGLKPIYWVIASAALATFCFNFFFVSLHGYFDNFGDFWQYPVAGALGLVSLAMFCKACRAGYRSYWAPLLATSAVMVVGSIVLLSLWIVGSNGYQGFNRFQLSRDVRVAHSTLERLSKLNAYVQKGKEVFARARSPLDIPSEYTSALLADEKIGLADQWLEMRIRYADPHHPKESYVTPSDFVSAMVDGRVWGINAAYMSFKGAKDTWLKNSDRALQSVPQAESNLRLLLDAAAEARSGRLFFFNRDVYSETVTNILVFTPALLFIDGILFITGRRRWGRLSQIAK